MDKPVNPRIWSRGQPSKIQIWQRPVVLQVTTMLNRSIGSLQAQPLCLALRYVSKYFFLIVSRVDHMIKNTRTFNPQRACHSLCLYDWLNSIDGCINALIIILNFHLLQTWNDSPPTKLNRFPSFARSQITALQFQISIKNSAASRK